VKNWWMGIIHAKYLFHGNKEKEKKEVKVHGHSSHFEDQVDIPDARFEVDQCKGVRVRRYFPLAMMDRLRRNLKDF
jgi:hypothetical protein